MLEACELGARTCEALQKRNLAPTVPDHMNLSQIEVDGPGNLKTAQDSVIFTLFVTSLRHINSARRVDTSIICMMSGSTVAYLLKYASISAAVSVALFAVLLGLLTTSFFQAHVVYLHGIQMTWFKDLDVPEMFGFLYNQARARRPHFTSTPLMVEGCMPGIFCLSNYIVSMKPT
jgi:hypothetical protein